MYWYEKAADQGNKFLGISARNQIGDMYFKGMGVSQSYSQALSWYKKAVNTPVTYGSHLYEDELGNYADIGYTLATLNIASMYYNGEGIAKDYSQAFSWYQKVSANSTTAQNSLGIMYIRGEGISQDYSQAFYWFKKAADKGFAEAQYNLGEMYYSGDGVIQDYSQAFFWFKKAADQNFQPAKDAIYKMQAQHLINK